MRERLRGESGRRKWRRNFSEDEKRIILKKSSSYNQKKQKIPKLITVYNGQANANQNFWRSLDFYHTEWYDFNMWNKKSEKSSEEKPFA